MKHIMKTAFALVLAVSGALPLGGASARPTYNPGPRPPINVVEVWYCKYERPGVERYSFIVEMDPGQACPGTYTDTYGTSTLVEGWIAPQGGVLIP